MLAKVCLVGPKGAGKSTLTSRIDSAAFLEQTVNSGAVFANCNVLVGNKTVDLQISDVSGEEKLRCMGPIYFKRAVAAMCVFDLSSENSFDALGSYIKSVKDNAVDECVLVIVGNKLDLGNRRVTKERGNKFAASVGGKYFEVSAVSGIGLLTVLIYLAKRILRLNDCNLNYGAKRSISSNSISWCVPTQTKPKPKKLSLNKLRYSI